MTSLDKISDGPPQGATTSEYVKEAFLFRWNLLFFLGGAAGAALTPLAPVLLPLVGAGEPLYLAGLISVPRFRAGGWGGRSCSAAPRSAGGPSPARPRPQGRPRGPRGGPPPRRRRRC